IVLRAFADTRSFTERPSASDITVTLSRFGRNRRLVLRFEWLTLCPTWAPLPVSSHRRDMAKSFSEIKESRVKSGVPQRHAGSGRHHGDAAPAMQLAGDRGRIVAGAGSVKGSRSPLREMPGHSGG